MEEDEKRVPEQSTEFLNQELHEIRTRLAEGSADPVNALDVLLFDGNSTLGAIAGRLHLEAAKVQDEIDTLVQSGTVRVCLNPGRLPRYSV